MFKYDPDLAIFQHEAMTKTSHVSSRAPSERGILPRAAGEVARAASRRGCEPQAHRYDDSLCFMDPASPSRRISRRSLGRGDTAPCHNATLSRAPAAVVAQQFSWLRVGDIVQAAARFVVRRAVFGGGMSRSAGTRKRARNRCTIVMLSPFLPDRISLTRLGVPRIGTMSARVSPC